MYRIVDYRFVELFPNLIVPTLCRVEQVRDAQLRAGSSAGMSGVWVADALGLPMHRDGLHLLTNGQVQYLISTRAAGVERLSFRISK